VLTALLDGDLAGASARCGVDLPPFFLEEGWLWRIRLDQVRADPGGPGLGRARARRRARRRRRPRRLPRPPDADGMVEVAYTVVPTCAAVATRERR
jgi:hypothetical protein